MAITIYTDFVNNYLVKNGMIGNADNMNKAPDQLKKEIDEINAAKVDLTTAQTIAGVKTFSSTIVGSVSGNAGTATKLAATKTINGVAFDGSANINVNTVASEVIKFDTGTTEGTDLYTFNGSTAKTIDIKAGTNVTLTKTAGAVTISANDTAVAVTEITGMGTGASTFLATPTSANLAAMLTDETGTGANVFANSPTLVTPNIGVATGTSFNSITGLSSSTPNMDGTAAVGTSTTAARADHIHASDTTKANLSGAAFTGNISAPLFTGSVSGTATNAIYQVASSGATCDAKFKQTPAHGTSFSECSGAADAPNTGWWMIYSIRHSNTSNYWGTQIAYGWEDNANAMYQRNIQAGTWSGWTRVDVSGANITELANNAGFITSSGRAYPRRSDGGDLNFYWSGQGGQPTWLWGGTDGNNMYVYNPSNFSVNYANSAGNADTVDGYHASSFALLSGATFTGAISGTSFNSITGLSSTTPLMNGTAAVGTGVTTARADHVHPSDTTKVTKVASTDNAITRFDGTTGNVQNSLIGVDDLGNIGSGTQTFNGFGGSGFKNYIINGNFSIWARASTQTTSGYGSVDRWKNVNIGSTKTCSAINSGDTERGFFESATFFRTAVTSVVGAGNTVYSLQAIEDVTRLAGKTVTLSFWAKANASKNIVVGFGQAFGSGGSSQVDNIGNTTIALTSTWQKKTVTVNIPSIVGKTLGSIVNTSTYVMFTFDGGTIGSQSGTFDIAQVQLEVGALATPFENRPYALELQLCQRYFENTQVNWGGYSTAGTINHDSMPWHTIKRIVPTVTFLSPAYNNTSNLDSSPSNAWQFVYSSTMNSTGYGSISSIVTADAEII